MPDLDVLRLCGFLHPRLLGNWSRCLIDGICRVTDLSFGLISIHDNLVTLKLEGCHRTSLQCLSGCHELLRFLLFARLI